MYYEKLEKQKKYLLKDIKINIFLLCFELLFLIICLIATISSELIIGLIALVPVAAIIFTVRCLAESNRLLRQLSSIIESKALDKTYQIKLCRPKINFLVCPEVRPYPSFSPNYYGMTFIDNDNNKYHYVFEDTLKYDKASVGEMHEIFYREFCIQCYENTSIIKTIENESYFIRIRNGSIL